MKKRPLLILTGPTATGKSSLSIELAKRICGSIISADSMQVYRHMDIGSAKISRDEMNGIPHYLIDVLEPTESFDVHRFLELAREAAEDIYSKDRIPIVCGGTGFYIQALVYDIDFTDEDNDPDFRKELWKLVETRGGRRLLYDRLMKVDKQAAEDIHPNNIKRIIRALEYHHLTGERISAHNARMRKKESPYDFLYFVLTDDRERLYCDIDRRVDGMLAAGLVEEVESLVKMGVRRDMTSMQGIGYKEALDYLDGILTRDEMIRIIKRDTRHYAKRQLTWFRRERDVIFINKEEFSYDNERILGFIESCVQKAWDIG